MSFFLLDGLMVVLKLFFFSLEERDQVKGMGFMKGECLADCLWWECLGCFVIRCVMGGGCDGRATVDCYLLIRQILL